MNNNLYVLFSTEAKDFEILVSNYDNYVSELLINGRNRLMNFQTNIKDQLSEEEWQKISLTELNDHESISQELNPGEFLKILEKIKRAVHSLIHRDYQRKLIGFIKSEELTKDSNDDDLKSSNYNSHSNHYNQYFNSLTRLMQTVQIADSLGVQIKIKDIYS